MGRIPSGRISRQSCKEHLQGTCTNSSCEKCHSPECVLHKTEKGCKFGEKCAFAHRWVEEQPRKRFLKNGTKVQWQWWKKRRNWVVYFRIWSRRSHHWFFGRVQPCGDRSEEFDLPTLQSALPKFESKIHRSTKFAQVNLISETRTLQNLRIGLRRRQSGKSIGLAKQRGRWRRKSWSERRKRKLHSCRPRKTGLGYSMDSIVYV